MSSFTIEEESNFYAHPSWAQEAHHPWVLTSFSIVADISGSHSVANFESYVQSIEFINGVSSDDVLLTNDGFGNLAVTVLQMGSIVDSYVIPYFEDGKTIIGFGQQDPFGGFSSFEAEGEFTVEKVISGGGTTSYAITAQGGIQFFEQDVSFTYFLESMSFSDGTFNLYGGIPIMHGTDSGESILGFGVNDTTGGLYHDTIRGLGGDDSLSGLEGDDTLEGGEGADYLYGGLNDDTYVWSVGDGNDTISEEGGLDKLVLNGVLPADVRFEHFTDGPFSHNLTVHIGDESITVGGQFSDHYFPGNGYDVYQVESLVFGDGTEVGLLHNLTFTGTGESETVYGLNDDNILRGLGGDDYFYDTLGNDTYEWSVGDGNDTISEEGGLDKLVLNGVLPADVRFEHFTDGPFSHNLTVHIGDESITVGGQFSDHYFPGNGYDVYQVESLVFGDGTEVGLLHNLTFTGTGESETVYGLNDDNILRGLGGDDYFYDTLGNDTYEWSVGDGNDTISEEGGLDKLVLNGVLPADVRFEHFTDGPFSHNLTVHIGDESITVGGQFSDHYFPGNGYDVYQVESLVFGDGTEVGLLHNLTFTGTGESETVYGLNDDNILRGLGGDDTLYGYEGADTLEGGEGADYLVGAEGGDSFVLDNLLGVDTIADFAPGDKIDVRGLFGASPGLYPSQAFANGYLRLEQVGSDTYLYADTDGGLGANPEQLLAYISGVDASALNTETDFILPSATPNTDPRGGR
jgi:Ca2+-binding RTX toxin-like protein